MGNFNRILASMSGIVVCGLIASGCAPKDLADGMSKTVNFAQEGVIFKEVEYGAAVGTVVVPNFQVGVTQISELFGINPANGQLGNVSTSVSGNLPEVGVSSNVNDQSVFAYAKLYTAACTDKCSADRGAGGLCAFQNNAPLSAAANSGAWNNSVTKLAQLLWGRTELTPAESAALTTLRDEVLAAKDGGQNVKNEAAFHAVCTAMALSPDYMVQ